MREEKQRDFSIIMRPKEMVMARILIVDDDEITRCTIADFLRKQGHDCTPVENVAQARSHLHRKRFELTISDFHMPCQTGLDLLRYVSSNSPSTSFILISGETNSCLRKEALALGAAAYVAKPFKLQELLNKVKNALRRTSSLH
jgi:DNA-binding NtrC family response regulator